MPSLPRIRGDSTKKPYACFVQRDAGISFGDEEDRTRNVSWNELTLVDEKVISLRLFVLVIFLLRDSCQTKGSPSWTVLQGDHPTVRRTAETKVSEDVGTCPFCYH